LGIQSGLDSWQKEGISILLSRYLDLLINLGDQVCVNIPFSGENKDNLLETRVLATVVGVTPQGHLRLQTSGNREEIIQGEISLAPGKISLGYTQFSV
jgi:BirA family biotin operon repressor/biotin-[acetyl-CoA-carboxylase] ligase